MSTEIPVEATEVIEQLLDQIRVLNLQLAIANAKADKTSSANNEGVEIGSVSSNS